MLVAVVVAHPNSAADATLRMATANHFGLMIWSVTEGILAASSRSELSRRRVPRRLRARCGRIAKVRRGAAVNWSGGESELCDRSQTYAEGSACLGSDAS